MLHLGGEVRLGGALLCLGGLENSENLGSSSPRQSIAIPRRTRKFRKLGLRFT